MYSTKKSLLMTKGKENSLNRQGCHQGQPSSKRNHQLVSTDQLFKKK